MKAEDILKDLNDNQKKAAQDFYGPTLVIATAGSGKTRVIIARTQLMLLAGIDANNILLTTFTNKAAKHMKNKIVEAVGDIGKNITVGTFHSVCNRILRKYADKIGYDKCFTILDEDEITKITNKIEDKYNIQKNILKHYISKYKTKCITPTMAINSAISSYELQIATSYQEYQDELKREMAMDFDDLLLNTVILLENNKDVLEEVNRKWEYILTDEDQDTSDLDSKLIKVLGGKKQNIFFVGDDEQSIYGFRGSNVENILNLNKTYPNLKYYDLEVNYRSTDNIIQAAKSLISHNKHQMKKTVRCGRKNNQGDIIKGPPIIETTCKSQADEAIKVLAYIKKLSSENVPLKEIAILFRTSYLTRPIEEILMKNKIKYELIGGTPFFCRTEIQDILSYARLTVNEYDLQAFKRTIYIPRRGVGEKTLEKVDDFCLNGFEEPLSIRQALNNIDESDIKGKALKGLKEYNTFLNTLDEKKETLSAKDFISYIIENLDYTNYLKENYKEDFEEKIKNLEELLNVCDEYNNIEDILTQASLYREELHSDEDAVQLMTIHKSKG